MRYLILASPRSGSTLLGRLLHATGKAGDPLEYFNPYLLKDERERRGLPNLTYLELIQLAEKESSSPNGVFGMHLHFSQFYDAFKPRGKLSPEMARFLQSFDKFVWIRRRDRIRQAVSWSVARKTRAFTSKETGKPVPSDIHLSDLMISLRLVGLSDLGWEAVLQDGRIPHKMIWYEDLVEDYRGVSLEVLSHLELDKDVSEIPEPPIKKQATDLNEHLALKLIDFLGIKTENSGRI